MRVENSESPARSGYDVALRIPAGGAEVRLNGYPIARPGDAGLVAAIPANVWIVGGRNSLELRFASPPGAAPATAEVRRTPFGGSPAALASTDYDPASGRLRAAGRTAAGTSRRDEFSASVRTVAAEFFVAPEWPRWAWQDAPEIAPGPQTVYGLRRAMSYLHARLSARDLDGFLGACAEMHRERAAAYGFAVEDVTASEARIYGELLASDEIRIQPMAPDGVHLALHCGRKVAQLTDDLGESPLFFADENWDRIVLVNLHFRATDAGDFVVCR